MALAGGLFNMLREAHSVSQTPSHLTHPSTASTITLTCQAPPYCYSSAVISVCIGENAQ